MINERFPHTVSIYRINSTTNPFVEDEVKEVIYEGKCRSYTQTTSRTGVVIASVRTLAIGKALDTANVLLSVRTGDHVDISIGTRIEEGIVIDVLPNNFGTDITWEYGRN